MEFAQALRSLNDHSRAALLALDTGRSEDVRVQLREIQHTLLHLSPAGHALARRADGIGAPTAKGT